MGTPSHYRVSKKTGCGGEALERIAESREEIAALRDGDFKAGLVAALDELERRHSGEPEETALEIAAG